MTWLLVLPLALALWWLWDIRRVLRVRHLTPVAPRRGTRANFAGALPPNRYVVVRWPKGTLEYAGCQGATARQVYEHAHPRHGEEVELWEQGTCRGHK